MPSPLQPSNSPVESVSHPVSTGVSLVGAAKLTVRQASRKAGISESQMRTEILKGKLAVIRIGSKMLVLERDLEAYLRGHYGIVQSFGASDAIPSRLTADISDSPLINPGRRSA